MPRKFHVENLSYHERKLFTLAFKHTLPQTLTFSTKSAAHATRLHLARIISAGRNSPHVIERQVALDLYVSQVCETPAGEFAITLADKSNPVDVPSTFSPILALVRDIPDDTTPAASPEPGPGAPDASPGALPPGIAKYFNP